MIYRTFRELSKEEIESKFECLAIAFDTDKWTLKQRLELQTHYRQVAEEDVCRELILIRDSVNVLNQVFSSMLNGSRSEDIRNSVYELFPQIHQNVDVVQRCVNAISSRSEVLGTVKEELRLSRAFELILLHVENLKRERDKERFRLKEARKLLINVNQSTNRTNRSDKFASVEQLCIDEQTDEEMIGIQRYQRSISVAIPARSVSIAVKLIAQLFTVIAIG
ncbi:protein MRVI1-like isoform X2 [Leptotrombidium deliense]|uniref:Protein MRVI1-like isoform X2 n=1 Tax=Leptotrombidium deliense TaxID=299467 RepID=A0A443SMZ0_9ACAR|nr:protein MRVI1-like isoform X2 [Leptotrombidium deliense]